MRRALYSSRRHAGEHELREFLPPVLGRPSEHRRGERALRPRQGPSGCKAQSLPSSVVLHTRGVLCARHEVEQGHRPPGARAGVAGQLLPQLSTLVQGLLPRQQAVRLLQHAGQGGDDAGQHAGVHRPGDRVPHQCVVAWSRYRGAGRPRGCASSTSTCPDDTLSLPCSHCCSLLTPRVLAAR